LKNGWRGNAATSPGVRGEGGAKRRGEKDSPYASSITVPFDLEIILFSDLPTNVG
jgi:hypothetical protein